MIAATKLRTLVRFEPVTVTETDHDPVRTYPEGDQFLRMCEVVPAGGGEVETGVQTLDTELRYYRMQ